MPPDGKQHATVQNSFMALHKTISKIPATGRSGPRKETIREVFLVLLQYFAMSSPIGIQALWTILKADQ